MADAIRPYNGLIANNIDGALAWYEKNRNAVLNQPLNLYNWTRLLCSIGRRQEALPLFDRLADNEEYAMFAAGQRLIEAITGGSSPEAALNTTSLGAAERYRAPIAAALSEFDITRRPAEARHIAISGISFCGSTVMDMILEGLPGVASIGESVWLTTAWVNQKPGPFTYGDPKGPGLQQCNHCGASCEYLTPNFRTMLGLNPVDWYFHIAERLKTKTLVSADKNLPKIVLFDPELRLTGLVVFKSPKQAWSSNYTKTSKNFTTPGAAFDAMIKFMDVWKQAYGDLANKFKPRGGKIFLDFDRFTETPEALFPSLVRALDLEYDPAALVSPSAGHSLGGNSKAIRRVHTAGHRVEIYKLGEPAIPADHAAWIDNQPDLNELHGELRDLSRDDLAKAA